MNKTMNKTLPVLNNKAIKNKDGCDKDQKY